MAIPDKPTIQTMDYSLRGQPWVNVASKSGIDLDTLDYLLQGQPWWGIEDTGGETKSLTDTSTGIDEQSIANTLELTEGALGGDFLDLSASLSLNESGLGTELLSSSTYVIFVDVGSGTDEILLTSTIISGSAVWGQITGALETNIRTYANNWAGTGAINGSGDSEQICLSSGQYMISEIIQTGVIQTTLLQNEYASGDTVLLQYRHGATEADCLAASWNTYSIPFTSLGYVQIRIESTL